MTQFTLGETRCFNCRQLIVADEEFSHAAGKFRHIVCPALLTRLEKEGTN